jgi:transcriptional regulator with XRE-family HTH domain
MDNSRAMANELKYRIDKRLKAVGMSARAASLAAGMSGDAIRNIQRGLSAAPNTDTMLKLARVLECRLSWLMAGEGPETEDELLISQSPGSGVGALNETARPLDEPPGAAAARAAKERKIVVAGAIMEAPELAAWLLATYRDLYAAEGVAISEADLVWLTLSDYAELVTEYPDADIRQNVAQGMAAKQRKMIREQKNGA